MADGRLDVTSKDFDPEACLAAANIDDVQLPCPDAAELGNIKKCIALVPQAVRDEMEQELGGIVLKPKPQKTEEEKARNAEKKAFMCQRAAQHMETVQKAFDYDPIETIIQRVRKGPLMLLRRAYESACEVDVVTRHARGIKGVLRGKVHGFDKFMNMLVSDAEEWLAHRVPVEHSKPKPPRAPTVPAPLQPEGATTAAQSESFDGNIAEASDAEEHQSAAPDGATGCCEQPAVGESAQQEARDDAQGERTQTRHGWRQVLRRRKLARLLLRGDQIVMITLAKGPMRLPATLRHLAPASGNVEVGQSNA